MNTQKTNEALFGEHFYVHVCTMTVEQIASTGIITFFSHSVSSAIN